MDNLNQDARNSTNSLADERARLEIEKLKTEIESLRNSTGIGAKLAQYNPVFTVLIAVVGTIISIQQFNKQQIFNTQQHTQQEAHNRAQLKEQSDREFTAREQESKKRYWEEQNQIYKEACDAAATIATANSLDEVGKERKNFWRLYWGIMSLVEHREVEGAMIDFGEKLGQWELTRSKPGGIKNYSYRIAHCCRKSLQKTWSPVDIGGLKDEGCPY